MNQNGRGDDDDDGRRSMPNKFIRTENALQELALTPRSKSYDVWKKPPMPLNFDIYLFNWTNPCNFTAGGYEKPILQQIGPFRFKELPEKFNIRWHTKNSTVSYQKRSRYYFDEEGSKASLDDEITALNVIALVSFEPANQEYHSFQCR